jgi:hypothetical protein
MSRISSLLEGSNRPLHICTSHSSLLQHYVAKSDSGKTAQLNVDTSRVYFPGDNIALTITLDANAFPDLEALEVDFRVSQEGPFQVHILTSVFPDVRARCIPLDSRLLADQAQVLLEVGKLRSRRRSRCVQGLSVCFSAQASNFKAPLPGLLKLQC